MLSLPEKVFLQKPYIEGFVFIGILYKKRIGLHQIFMKREVAATLDAAMRKARIEAR